MTATLTSFNALNQLEMDIEIVSNPFQLDLSDLFELGARVNPKRSFLFVSKVIGKHLDVHPDIPKAAGYLLANLLTKALCGSYFSDVNRLASFLKIQREPQLIKNEFDKKFSLKDPTLFIAFAETATGLGHAVFSAFHQAFFVHTTREDLMNAKSLFDFQEEHSHAVDHRCYLMNKDWIRKAKQIVLIDDEITTGKTTLNLIRSMHQVYPKQKYFVLSILDWRAKEHEQAFASLEEELKVEIVPLSLLRGTFQLTKEAFFLYEDAKTPNFEENFRTVDLSMMPKFYLWHRNEGLIPYLKGTGRFGIDSVSTTITENCCKKIGGILKGKRQGKNTLVLGIGEFMYIPSRIASYMGEGVCHKSTTRSPIYPSSVDPGYPIYERLRYEDDNGITHYMYNMSGKYDEAFLIFEREPSVRLKKQLAGLLNQSGIKHVTMVML